METQLFIASVLAHHREVLGRQARDEAARIGAPPCRRVVRFVVRADHIWPVLVDEDARRPEFRLPPADVDTLRDRFPCCASGAHRLH